MHLITTKLRQQVPQHLHLLHNNLQQLTQHPLQIHQPHPLQQLITIYQQHNENKQLDQQQHLFNSLFKVGKVKTSMCQRRNENKQLKQLKQLKQQQQLHLLQELHKLHQHLTLDKADTLPQLPMLRLLQCQQWQHALQHVLQHALQQPLQHP
jgi:hypothetical protein